MDTMISVHFFSATPDEWEKVRAFLPEEEAIVVQRGIERTKQMGYPKLEIGFTDISEDDKQLIYFRAFQTAGVLSR